MKNTQIDAYYNFFLELPPTDYLVDIEIQDDIEQPNENTTRGLSAEQVSQIAIDSLNAAKPNPNSSTPTPANPDAPSS
jgi:hypothetical protein